MPNLAEQYQLSEQDYLAGESDSPIKHEYIDGEVYAMAGASANHNLITGNIHGELRTHLKGKPCRPFASDMKVKIGSRYFYPDVLVDCGEYAGDDQFTETPTLIVEVLSKSTRRMDETTKRSSYMQIDSLQEYLLIEQDIVDVELVRRSNGWRSEHFFMGDQFTLESVGLTLSVAEIYDRVKNADVTDWLLQQAALAEAEAAATHPATTNQP
ncbi:MAG: Uma2 family endonuclease [Moraxellaceae bacterium]